MHLTFLAAEINAFLIEITLPIFYPKFYPIPYIPGRASACVLFVVTIREKGIY